MRDRKKFVIPIALVVALAFALSFTGAGAESNDRDEGSIVVDNLQLIYGELGHSGEIEKLQVIDQLSLDGRGTITVEKETDLTETPTIQGLRGFATPKAEEGTITWEDVKVSGLKNVISAATVQKDDLEVAQDRIPLETTFRYWLDGEEVEDVNDIAGKDGHFKMSLKMKNTSKEKTKVSYTDSITGEKKTETVETYLPLVIQPYDWYFDNSVFYNMQCDETGLIVNMPTVYQVGWSIPLFPPATEESHTIWIEADVKDFWLDSLTLAIAFVFPHTNQIDPIPEFRAGLDGIYGGVVELGAGLSEAVAGVGTTGTSDTLLYGASEMASGLNLMISPTEGIPAMETGITGAGGLIPGVDEAIAGIGAAETPDTLLYGTSEISTGLSEMLAGIGSPDIEDTLLYASSAVSGGLSDIKTNIGSATTADTLLYATNSVIGGLTDMQNNIGSATTDDTLLFAMNSMTGGLTDMQSNIGSAATADTLLFAEDQIRQGLEGITNTIGSAGAAGTVRSYLATALWQITDTTVTPGTLYEYLVNTGVPGGWVTVAGVGNIMTWLGTNTAVQVGTADGTLAYLQGVIGSTTTADTLLYASNSVTGGLTQISAGIGSATTADSLLYASNAVTDGLNQISAGIGSATTADSLLYAMNALSDGLVELNAGIGSVDADDTLLFATNAITGGLVEMGAGIGSAETADTLLYGSYSVFSGLSLMKNEMSTGSTANPGMREGLALIASGLDEAIAGVGSVSTADTLLYGAAQIESGLDQLKAGLELAVNEGTNVMQEELEKGIAELDLTEGELVVIEERGEEYDSFLGRVDDPDASSEVRLLFQTDPVRNPGSKNGWIIALVISAIAGAVLVGLGIFAYFKLA